MPKADPKIKLKTVPLNLIALNGILFPRSRNFPFYGSRFGLALTGQTRPLARHTERLFSLHAAVPRALNTATEPSSACAKSGGGGAARSGARQITINPPVHAHPAMIRITYVRLDFACTLGAFPIPCGISERIQMLRHGGGTMKLPSLSLSQAMRVRYHCECKVG